MSRIRHGMILGLVAIAASLSAMEAHAQVRARFGINIGNGGVRVGLGNGSMYGYGPGFYGPGTGYGYGYRPPVVCAPQPVLVPQPVYVPQPGYGLPQTQYPTPQAIPTAPGPLADGGEIVIFSPAANVANVNYALNGQVFTMIPGTKQQFVNDRSWTIQFETAPGQVATYSLKTGRYKFKSTPAGLALVQTQDTPEAIEPGLPPAPIPNPPEPDAEATVIPSRPALKTAP